MPTSASASAVPGGSAGRRSHRRSCASCWTSVEQRATALTDAGPARLIQCRDVALANLLSTDPATAAHCTRAGERQLCVPEKKLAAFRKGLGKARLRVAGGGA
jgi:hypothetical protein